MRTDRRLQIIVVLLLVVFCGSGARLAIDAAEGGALPSHGGDAVRPRRCVGEAELLKSQLALRPAPNPATAPTVVLMPGTSIYRCEQRGAFHGIMFPEEDGRVDCSMRPPGRECPTGWTDEQLETEITG